METKDRWWLGSASLSGEEYPYLLRKLEYWGTTFNNASLTTKASQLRLPLSRSSSPTLSLRNWSNLCILSRDVRDTIEILDDRKKNLRFVSKKFAFRGRSERGSLRFQFRIGTVSISIILAISFFLLLFFSLGSFIRPKKGEKTFLSSREVRDQIPRQIIRPIYCHSFPFRPRRNLYRRPSLNACNVINDRRTIYRCFGREPKGGSGRRERVERVERNWGTAIHCLTYG